LRVFSLFIAEEDYPLPDAHPEDNKYQVDLARSIKRAREVVEAGKSGNKNKEKTRKLLEGHTFYVTPRVPVDTKLLKNVVVACGGQVCFALSLRPPSVVLSS